MLNYENLRVKVPAPGAAVDWSWLLNAIPALEKLSSCKQDPVYHAEGDVLTHTKWTVDELVNGSAYGQASEEERFILFYAMLLHDIAKPDTTVVDPVTGKIGQPGHSRRGTLDARILLWKAGVPFNAREAICRIISVHQLPFFAVSGNRSGHSGEFLIHKLSHEMDIHLLCAVAEADMRGRSYVGKADCLVDIELFREMARDEGCYRQAKAFPDAHTRVCYFRGAGIAPDYPFHQEPGSKVIVLSGLPASGKNTWVAKHLPKLPVISFDDARDELGLKHGANEGKAAHFAIDAAKELLRAKKPFIWNATHISSLMRKKTLDLLYAYSAEVELVYLEQPQRVLFQRNSKRDTTLTNAAIERMLFRWEVPLPTEAHSVRYEVVT